MRFTALIPLATFFSQACSQQLSKDPNDATTPTVTDPNLEDNDGDGFTENEGDCDDGNINVFPQAEEICDSIDNDCDNEIDEDATDSLIWYVDEDRDGYGEEGTEIEACEAPSESFSDEAGDCDDNNNTIHPAAIEVCDDIDNDCDGAIDDEDDDVSADGFQEFFTDADGDGYGDANSPVEACALGNGMVENSEDCDDNATDINPMADEVCDNLDNDCDGLLDDEDDSLTGSLNTYYLDSDGDGYGDYNASFDSCGMEAGYVDNSDDCDDGNSAAYPGAAQLDSATDCMLDADGDGYGAGAGGGCTYTIEMSDSYGDGWNNAGLDLEVNGQAIQSYTLLSGNNGTETFSVNGGESWSLTFQSGAWDSEITFVVTDSTGATLWNMNSTPSQGDSYSDSCGGGAVNYVAGSDCNDSDIGVFPGASDTAYDGIDADCAGDSDYDADGDGYESADYNGDDCDDNDASINPGATEIYYDNIDQDCAGDSDFDADGDGYDDASNGGEDCDDSDADINPMAPEDTTDGIDNNCDGQIDEQFASYLLGDTDLTAGQPMGVAIDNENQVHFIWKSSSTSNMSHRVRSATGTWTSESQISSGESTGDFLDFAVDGIDRIQLAYSAYDGSSTYLDFRYYDIYNESWSAPLMVEEISSSSSISPNFRLGIDTDSTNLPSIVYYDTTDLEPMLVEVDSPLNNSLNSLSANWISLDYGYIGFTGTHIDVAIDGNGTSHTVWFNDVLDAENQYNAVTNGNDEGECTDFWGTSDSYVESNSDGIYNSIAVKSTNVPCVAYIDASNDDLMYACNSNSNPCDQGWTVETVASNLSGTAYSSLAFNSLDEPYIAFYKGSTGDLKLAHNPGSGWVIYDIDGVGNVGNFSSLAIDENDAVHIIYYDATNQQVRYATGQ